MENILQDRELININGGVAQALDHIIIRSDKCTKCNVCADYCTNKAIVISQNGVYSIRQDLCNKCGICVGVRPVGAIRKDSLT